MFFLGLLEIKRNLSRLKYFNLKSFKNKTIYFLFYKLVINIAYYIITCVIYYTKLV